MNDTFAFIINTAVGNILIGLDGLGKTFTASIATSEAVYVSILQRVFSQAIESVIQITVGGKAVYIPCCVLPTEILQI